MRNVLLSLVLLSLGGCDSRLSDDLAEQATSGWTLAAQPLVTIGEQDGDPALSRNVIE